MISVLKSDSTPEYLDEVLKKLRIRRASKKGINAFKYCGVVELRDNPVSIQKRMRNEWE